MKQPVTLIMIEDDPGHARLLEKNIRRAGVTCELLHFADGTSALNKLFSADDPIRGPLLILLDLNLPDMSGLEILAQLKADESMRRAPVVILTTTDDQAEVQRCYDLGASVYVTKPVIYEDFATAIRQLGLFVSIIQIPDLEPRATSGTGLSPS